MPPGTLDSGLRRYAFLLRWQVQGRRPWRARSAVSIAKREAEAAQRKAQNAAQDPQAGRPTKQDRRRIHRFKRELHDSQDGD
jgi:hypothetical protein